MKYIMYVTALCVPLNLSFTQRDSNVCENTQYFSHKSQVFLRVIKRAKSSDSPSIFSSQEYQKRSAVLLYRDVAIRDPIVG